MRRKESHNTLGYIAVSCSWAEYTCRPIPIKVSIRAVARDVPANQILQICTKSRDGMVSGLHRSGDAPVADRRPPGPTRSAATRV